MKKRISSFKKRIKEIINDQFMQIIPGQVAYSFLLSLIPLIALIVTVAGWFSVSVDSVVNLIQSSLPPETSNLIIPIIDGKGVDLSVIIFIITSFFMASNGAVSIINISNFLYKVERTNYLNKRIKSLFLTLLIIALFGFILLIPAFGSIIIGFAKNTAFVKPIYDEIMFVYNIIQIPLSLLFIYMAIKVIYTVSPSIKIKSKETTYGALFTTILWVLLSQIYSYYVTHFNNYNILYGSIANLIILLIWIYLLSYILVIGIAINVGLREDALNQINSK